MWSLCPWVQTMATTRRPATPSTIGPASWGGVDHEDLLVVAHQPDVVPDVEALPVEGEDAVGANPVDADGRQSTTTDRRTSPRSILWNASSTSSMPMVSDTNPRSSFPSR
jgi:hypothetical protein